MKKRPARASERGGPRTSPERAVRARAKLEHVVPVPTKADRIGRARTEKPERAPERDRRRTEEAILAAVGRLLESSGFDALGMNAVAREAGVDKVLVYRYFGKLPELLRAFAEHGGHWPSDAELVGEAPPTDPAALAVRMLVNFGRAIRARPQTQAILRRELEERNPLTDALADARERQAVRILGRLAGLELDAPAVGALLAAGLTYLALRANTARVYNGVDLRSDTGWKRLEGAVADIVSLLAGPRSVSPSERTR
jgi:AcrR family transcriptional regulator